jgi:hypothetical protein
VACRNKLLSPKSKIARINVGTSPHRSGVKRDQNFGDFGDEGQENDRMKLGRRGDDASRAVSFFFCSLSERT